MTTTVKVDIEDIARRRRNMESLTSIAKHYGVSREWIRHLLVAEYGTAWSDEIAENRVAVRESEMAAYRDQLIDRVAAGEVITTKDVIAGSPITVESAVDVLGEWSWIAQYAQRSRVHVTDKQIYESIHRVWKSAGASGPLSREQYDAARDPKSDISGARICQRMRWQEACAGAGIPVNSGLRVYAGLTEENAVEWLTAFLDAVTRESTAQYVGTVGQYEEWAKDYSAAPSASSLRIVMGSWNNARAKAVSVLCRWRKERGAEPYPLPERTTAGHTSDDVRAWAEMLRSDPSRSVASIAREVGVPVATLRYHLRGL